MPDANGQFKGISIPDSPYTRSLKRDKPDLVGTFIDVCSLTLDEVIENAPDAEKEAWAKIRAEADV